MRARACLRTEQDVRADGRERTRVAGLRSEAPLLLRPTLAKEADPWTAGATGAARVCLTAGAAGPLGGDVLSLAITVGAGSTLALHDVSATLLLPGPHGERSRLTVDLRVDAGGTLVWLPEPVIAAHGCLHVTDVRVELEPGARLLLREELLLGRHGEQPGAVRQSLRVRRDGRALHHQEIAVGPGAPGWEGPAVTGGHRAIGSLLVVDPAWAAAPPSPQAFEPDAALLQLAGPAVLISALAPDGLALRRALTRGLGLLGADGGREAGAPSREPSWAGNRAAGR